MARIHRPASQTSWPLTSVDPAFLLQLPSLSVGYCSFLKRLPFSIFPLQCLTEKSHWPWANQTIVFFPLVYHLVDPINRWIPRWIIVRYTTPTFWRGLYDASTFDTLLESSLRLYKNLIYVPTYSEGSFKMPGILIFKKRKSLGCGSGGGTDICGHTYKWSDRMLL